MKNTEENDSIRQTLKQAMPDDLPAAVEQRMQNRLTAFRQRFDAKSAKPRYRISQWIGGFTMRQRIAVFGGVGATAVLGFLLLWEGLAAKPVSAMERMAEAVRKARSYKCTETVKTSYDFPKPGKPAVMEAIYTIYRQLPGAARSDLTNLYDSWKGPGPERTEIFPVGQPMIHIFHPTKTFRRYPPFRKGPYSSVFDRLEDLGQFSSQADRRLGTKEINGKQADGFEIDMKKMHPDARGSVAEIWLDRATSLPLFVRMQFKGLDTSTTCEDRDIEWNIDLDPKLFDATPPEGYTDDTPKPPALEDQVRDIVAAMKIYAQASGGCYPAKDVHSLDTTEDLCMLLGVREWPGGKKDGNAGIAAKAIPGFEQMGRIRAYNPDAAYYGKTVGLKDKDRVLLRWKLDDGRYEVIFGDLRAETVTAEQLRALEGK